MGFDNLPPHPGSRLWDIEAVPFIHREYGTLFQLRDGYPSVPICFREAYPLHMEFVSARHNRLSQLPNPPADPEGYAYQILRDDVLAKDRQCSKWTSWIQNWSPERHFEEFKVLELEQQRKQFELKLYEMGERSQRRDRTVGFCLAIAGILLAIAQVLTATPDSLIVTWYQQRPGAQPTMQTPTPTEQSTPDTAGRQP